MPFLKFRNLEDYAKKITCIINLHASLIPESRTYTLLELKIIT